MRLNLRGNIFNMSKQKRKTGEHSKTSYPRPDRRQPVNTLKEGLTELKGTNMKVWKSQILKEILKESPVNCTTEISLTRSGDYDLNTIYIEIEDCGDKLFLTPFVDPYNSCCAPYENENVLVHALELKNEDSDSRGGCQTSNANLGMLYGFLKARLTASGFKVIDHYDQIFEVESFVHLKLKPKKC